jgi:poly(A) polymerase/tRNA nucleotidyltransferase (CCA-adding enzyme)
MILTLSQEHRNVLTPVMRLLHERDVQAWLVGGYVRDLLLGRPSDDIDVAVDGPALVLAREIADQTNAAFVALDDATESARIVWKTAEGVPTHPFVDLVRLRAPLIEADLRLRDLTINALAISLDTAMQSSIAMDALLDPTGGRVDLQARSIRPCSPITLLDDPLRMLRAVRIAAQLGFELAPETDAAIRQHHSRIDGVAHERVRSELLKLLAVRHAARWIIYLDTVRLLTHIIPELEPARLCSQPHEHFLPVLDHLLETIRAWEWLYDQIDAQAEGTQTGGVQDFEHFGRLDPPLNTLKPVAVQTHPQLTTPLPYADRIVERMQQPVMAGHQRYAFFKLAALLHDVAKPQTKELKPDGRVSFYDHQVIGAEVAGKIGQRLRLSREAVAYIQLVIREHMRPGQLNALGDELTQRAVYRFIRDTGDAAPDVLLHSLCDHLAARGPNLSIVGWARHVAWTGDALEMMWTPQRPRQSARLVTGNDLLRELGLQPGPIIGQLLDAVQEAQFLGKATTREEALTLARQRAAELEAGRTT